MITTATEDHHLEWGSQPGRWDKTVNGETLVDKQTFKYLNPPLPTYTFNMHESVVHSTHAHADRQQLSVFFDL